MTDHRRKGFLRFILNIPFRRASCPNSIASQKNFEKIFAPEVTFGVQQGFYI
jgi:hypothetical protein